MIEFVALPLVATPFGRSRGGSLFLLDVEAVEALTAPAQQIVAARELWTGPRAVHAP
jgi:hypothetical protein